MRFLIADIAGRRGITVSELHRLIIQQGDIMGYTTLLDIWNNKTGSVTTMTLQSFNSHPARKQGATGDRGQKLAHALVFQLSPCPKAGCYLVTDEDGVTDLKFQLSPCPKAGCYMRCLVASAHGQQFQLSPCPKAGCYAM